MRRHLTITLLAALVATTAAVAVAVAGPITGPMTGPAISSAPQAPSTAPQNVPEAASSSVGDGAEMPWALLDCEFVVAFVVVETAKLQALVPDGFTVRSPALNVADVRPPADRSLLGVEAETCEQGTSLEGIVDGMDYASIWVGVVPPEDLRVQGFAGGYFVNFDPLIPDEPRRALFDAVGVPVHDGQVAFETDPVQGVFEASWTLDGLGDLSIQATTVEDPIASPGGAFVQWTEAADGELAQWQVDWQMHTFFQGPGVVHVPAGTWIAELVGSETVPAPVVYYGTWDYTDGEILLPG